ncbi:sensor histidine kinase [Sandarakinorhabdus sp. DWP1-3-1]|uniref:sensor histidine kinase n=1 Tax=Sandarakinorhabdus sp. DWP1-3-1 TaxID=2804627 RepID=UPI003CF8E1E5
MTGPGAGTLSRYRWLNLKRLSLRRGLLLLLIAALLPITILSIAQGLVRVESRRASVIRHLSESAHSLADSNEMILNGAATTLNIAAMNPDIRDVRPQCAATLRSVQRLSPAYTNLARYNADGELVCSAVMPTKSVNIATLPEWQLARNSRKIMVSEARVGPITGKRIISLVLPLRSAQDEFEGTLGIAIDLAWLERRLAIAAATERDTGVAIFSDNGQRLISSRDLPPIDLNVPIGDIGRTRDEAGRSWSYTLVPLVRSAPGQVGLYVVYASPDAERFGVVWWQTVIDFTLPVLAILLASLAIWFGARQLVLRWLVALQRLALSFAGGDYRRRPVNFSEAPREIRSVAASLYRMSGAVGERDRRLRDSLERQRLLARELHHRVKNNFQMVMSLLSLQSSRLQNDAARQAIDQARRRIGALALVHRQLYDTGELASISAQTLLDALCQQLQPAGDSNVRLICDVDDVEVDIDTAVPMTLWVVETVNNALHHGFPAGRSGRVCVRFRAGKPAVLSVTDDGVGFSPDSLAGDTVNGQGLRLIRALSSQLAGTMHIQPGADGSGSTASLSFPLRAAEPAIGDDVKSPSS